MNHENEIDIATLAAMNRERLATALAEAAETSPCLWRRLHFDLTVHKGADAAAATREWIKDLSEQTSFLDAEQIREHARELDAIRAAIVTHVAIATPHLAPELMWKFFELAQTIFERTSEEGWEFSCVFDEACSDLIKVSAYAGIEPTVFAEEVLGGMALT